MSIYIIAAAPVGGNLKIKAAIPKTAGTQTGVINKVCSHTHAASFCVRFFQDAKIPSSCKKELPAGSSKQ